MSSGSPAAVSAGLPRMLIPADCGQSQAAAILPDGRQAVLDNTSLECWLFCARRYYFEILWGWRSFVGNLHLDFGIALHRGLEVWAECHRSSLWTNEDAVLQAVVAALRSPSARRLPPLPDDPRLPPKHRGKCRLGLVRAIVWYADEHQGDNLGEIVQVASSVASGPAIELHLTAPLPFAPERRWAGYVDWILGGAFAWTPVDHKTTSDELTGARAGQFRPSHQLPGYLWLVRQAFPEARIPGIVVNSIRLLPDGAEWARDMPDYTAADEAEWLADVAAILPGMDRAAEERFWPRNPGNCWRCTFRTVCREPLELQGAVLEERFERRVWDPAKPRGAEAA